MLFSINSKDARNYQIAFQLTFIVWGIYALGWEIKPLFFLLTAAIALLTQYWGNRIFKLPQTNLKSAFITALGLTLLLRTNLLSVQTLAAFVAIASKFIFRIDGRHFVNPANFAIVFCILLTQQAWISPGQWGSAALLFFLVGTLGFIVLTKAHRIDIAICFLGSLFILQFLRSYIYLGWPMDHLWHQFSNGSLLLFTFFMITDPASTPQHKWARRIWASLVAILAFYMANFKFIQGAPIWALFLLSFSTPLFNFLFSPKKPLWLFVQAFVQQASPQSKHISIQSHNTIN